MAASISSVLTVAQCLKVLGIKCFPEACKTMEQEFRIIRRTYLDSMIDHHPEKRGGDAELCRTIRKAFRMLAEIYQRSGKTIVSFLDLMAAPSSFYGFADQIPPYNHFSAIRRSFASCMIECGPSHRCSHCNECARAMRSTTKRRRALGGLTNAMLNSFQLMHNDEDAVKTPVIHPEGSIGPENLSVNVLYKGRVKHSYHLSCWPVPCSIWSGLTDPDEPQIVLDDLWSMNTIALEGLETMTEEEVFHLVEHVMNRKYWKQDWFPKMQETSPDCFSEKPDCSDCRT